MKMQPRPESCKCGRMSEPVFNYSNWSTGERFKFCYYCDPHETAEDRAMMNAAADQQKPAYPKGK